MGRLIFTLCIIISVVSANAQQLQGRYWIFGYYAGLEFNGNGIRNVPDSRSSHGFTGATISSKNGELLLYGSGDTLFGNNHRPIYPSYLYNRPRITNYSVESCIIIEDNYIPNKYCFLTTNQENNELSYFYIQIDTTTNPFTYIVSNNFRFNFQISNGLTVNLAENNKDYFITGVNYSLNELITLKMDSLGVTTHSTFPIVQRRIPDVTLLKSSPKSNLISYLSQSGRISLYRFDRTAGVILNELEIGFSDKQPYALSFSPNESNIFVSYQSNIDRNKFFLSEYSLLSFDAEVIINSEIKIDSSFRDIQNSGYMMFHQLAMDGKIYGGLPGRDRISIIDYPNQFGSNSGFRPNIHQLSGAMSQNFPALNQTLFRNADKLQATPSKDTVCAGDSVTLFAYGASMNTFRWRSNPTQVIAEVANPKVLVNETTTFFVTGSNPYETRDTSVRVVAVPPPPTPDLGPDVVFCTLQQPFLVSRNRLPTNLRYRWSTGANTVNIVPNDTGWYWLEVSNGYCSRRDSVKVLGFETPPQAVVNTPNTILCNESSTAIAANNPNINPLNRWRIIQGSGTIENINNAETRISNLPFGITKLVWEVAASRALNCFSSDTLTIERRRLPVSNIIGRRSICPGLPVSVYRADTNLIRSGSIVWNVKKGRVLSIENNSSLIRIQWQNEVTDSAEVNLFAFGKNDCPMADTLRFRVRVSPNLLPEPVLSSDTIFCFSDSSSVFSIADPQPAATYQWQVKNAEIVGSSTSNSVQISWRKFRKSNLSNSDSLPQVWYSERIETPITVCNGVSDTFRIRYQSDPTLAWQSDTFTCSNTTILIPTASNTPDSDSLLNGTTFTWQPNTYLGNPTGLQTSFLFPQSEFRNNQVDTTLQYIRTTRTGKGCLFVDTVNIRVYGRPQPIAFSLDSNLCLNDAQEINITNFNDSLNYFFAVSSDTSESNNLVFNPFNNSDTLLPQNSIGRFKITIFNLNKNGCSSDTLIKFYTINPLPNPDLSGNNKYICLNFLNNIPYRVLGKAGSSFSWSVSGGRALSDTGSQTLITWENTEIRSLQVTETDTNGCISQSEPFDILLDKNVDIPESGCKLSDYPLVGGNILTLNGDGINEQITFRNINLYGNCKLLLFNRYGTPIISIPNYQELNNYTPNSLAEGMYYYQLQSARAVVKGWLVVVR